MPNPDLPHIVGGKGGFEELAAKEPEEVRFMQKIVDRRPRTPWLLAIRYGEARRVQLLSMSCARDVKE